MVVLIHVLIALSSVGYTTYLLFSPSQAKFRVTYGLVTATILSGTYLVISTHSNMLQACLTGLAYICIVSLGIVIARYRFVTALQRNRDKPGY